MRRPLLRWRWGVWLSNPDNHRGSPLQEQRAPGIPNRDAGKRSQTPTARVCKNILACVWHPQSRVKRSFGDGEMAKQIRHENPPTDRTIPKSFGLEAATHRLWHGNRPCPEICTPTAGLACKKALAEIGSLALAYIVLVGMWVHLVGGKHSMPKVLISKSACHCLGDVRISTEEKIWETIDWRDGPF